MRIKINKPLRERQRSALRAIRSAIVLGIAGCAAAHFLPGPHSPSAVSLSPQPSVAPSVLREAQVGTDLANPQSPLLVIHARKQGVPFILIEGGVPQTRRSPLRCEVGQMVQAAGAQAGLNGTFFVDASLRGTDNILIGPSLCGNEAKAVFNPQDRNNLLIGRPLVLLAKSQTRLVPYDPHLMGTQEDLESWLPGLTDAFLGGVWLVHDGVAADRIHIDDFHVHDAEDPRRRAFFCLLPDGRPALGATTYVTPSADLALALQSMGVQEAVLLDSGFSTSLVYGKKILVTGHTSPGIPSRPVPHALVLFGKPALNTPRAVL
ncbi:MAG: phosphodiester glycosidase family protein, partial [Janthinobacterium lividum]